MRPRYENEQNDEKKKKKKKRRWSRWCWIEEARLVLRDETKWESTDEQQKEKEGQNVYARRPRARCLWGRKRYQGRRTSAVITRSDFLGPPTDRGPISGQIRSLWENAKRSAHITQIPALLLVHRHTDTHTHTSSLSICVWEYSWLNLYQRDWPNSGFKTVSIFLLFVTVMLCLHPSIYLHSWNSYF